MDRLANHPKFQAFDSNGAPLSGGKVYTYEAGGTTPKTTYSNRVLSSANANPVVLDSRGECAIYFSSTMKIVLKTSADVTVWTMDNLKSIDDTVLSDDDGDTKIQVEESADEDIIRFDTGGTERAVLDSDGLKLTPTPAGSPQVDTLYKDNIVRGWINLDGTGTIAISDSFNVASINDDGTGDYTVTWDTDFDNIDYAPSGAGQDGVYVSVFTITAAAIRIRLRDYDGTLTDSDPTCLIAIGVQ